MIRAVKNHFGRGKGLSLFDMTDHGLKEVIHLATIFLDHYCGAVAGSIVVLSRNGVRAFLIKVQAVFEQNDEELRQVG